MDIECLLWGITFYFQVHPLETLIYAYALQEIYKKRSETPTGSLAEVGSPLFGSKLNLQVLCPFIQTSVNFFT